MNLRPLSVSALRNKGLPAARITHGGQLMAMRLDWRPHPRPQAVPDFESQTMDKLVASLIICSPIPLLVKFCDGVPWNCAIVMLCRFLCALFINELHLRHLLGTARSLGARSS